MAHELDKDGEGNARLMYNARNGVPWHGLGTPVDGLATAEQAIRAAALDWLVELLPAYQRLAAGGFREVEGQFLITRDEDEAVFGNVSERYVPVQNRQAFEFVDYLVDSDEAKYDSCGALRGGKQVFLSAKLPTGCTVNGEEYLGHLLFTNAHTGLQAVTARMVLTRVICANTLSCAFGERTPVWSVAHVTGVEEKLEAARETLKLATEYTNDFARMQERMLESKVVQKQVAELIRQALPDRMRTPKNVEAAVKNVATSPTIPDDLRRTAFGVFNGFTEWMEHGRVARTAEGRFHNVLEGEGARSRDRLARLLLK